MNDHDASLATIMEETHETPPPQRVYPVRLIVAGSRVFRDRLLHDRVLTEILKPIRRDDVELVSGMAAEGPDAMVVSYAKEHDYPLKPFPAAWDSLGKKAGMIRNADMAAYGTHLLAFWDGHSKGTANMLDQAKRRGLITWTYLFDAEEQASGFYIPAFTATIIENNKVRGSSAVFHQHARLIAWALGFGDSFPDDHHTFPIERLQPAFKSLHKRLWEEIDSVPDDVTLRSFMSYVEENQLYITARRLDTFVSPIRTLAAPLVAPSAH